MKSSIIFRADGDNKIGLGHVIRSLALADMLSEVYDCIFLIRNPSGYLSRSIEDVCNKMIALDSKISYLEESSKLLELIERENNPIVVLDGYHFNTDYQKILKSSRCPLISIDDIHCCHFLSDVIINHSISAIREQYSTAIYTKLFLGLDYALLRKHFQNYARLRTSSSFQWNDNVFICLGGADPNNNLLGVLTLIRDSNLWRSKKYKVVLGSAYMFYNELLEWIEYQNLDIILYQSISEEQMLEVMKSCAIAICSPSSVAIEFMAVGGLLYMKCIAHNQLEFYRKSLELGIALSFNSFALDFNKHQGLEMYSKQKMLIDGFQHERILSIFNAIEYGIKC